jgi:acyl carrier protein
MSEQLVSELKALMIEGLHLEDIKADDIDLDEPLFGDGLGLDSIDALEISVLLDRKYGVRISSGDDRNLEIFSSLRALTAHVAANRSK